MTGLAAINTLLAFAVLVVFALLAKRAKTAIRFVYGAASLLMVYIVGAYGHIFAAGQPLGVEFMRPANGLLLVIILAVGIYELYRR